MSLATTHEKVSKIAPEGGTPAEPAVAQDRTTFTSRGAIPPVCALATGGGKTELTASERGFGGEVAGDLSTVVRIAPDATAEDVRDEILRGPAFGFEEADFAAMAKAITANPRFFFLEDSRSPGTPATGDQVHSWADPTTHLATITITGSRVAALHALKAARATGDVDAVLLSVDPNLREMLRPMLNDLLGTGDKRLAAASDLANLVEVPEMASKLAAVLGALQAHGYGNDALIPVLRGLANAKAAQAPDDFVGPTTRPGILDNDRADFAELDANNAATSIRDQSDAGTVDRRQANLVYSLSSRLYRKTGNVEAEERSAQMARNFLVGDKERAEVQKRHQTEIPAQVPGTVEMSAPTENEREIDEVREERARWLEEWEQLDGGREVPETPPMLESKSETTKLQNGQTVAERGNIGTVATGSLALATTFLKFMAAAKRTEIMVKLREREDKLTRKQWVESHYPVPAQPEELIALERRLEAIATTSATKAPRARAYAEKVREQLELSRAYYAKP